MDPNNQQPTQQPVAPQFVGQSHQPESHSSFSNILLISLGVVIVLGLMGGAYYLGTMQQKNNSIATMNKAVSTSPTQIPSPTVNQTANWQTLHNSNGFSISYPSSFVAHGVGMVDDPINSSEVMVGDAVKSNNTPYIEISAYDQKNNIKQGGNTLIAITMADYNAGVGNKNTYVSTVMTPQKTTVGGKDAEEYEIVSKGFTGSGSGWYNAAPSTWHVVEVENNGKFYTFVYQEDKFLQQIVGTLQFP